VNLITCYNAGEDNLDTRVCVFFFNFRYSLCHIHGLVIYKDVENPTSKNKALQEELQVVKDELNRLWQSTAAKNLKLM
jgi:hypothetical protein